MGSLIQFPASARRAEAADDDAQLDGAAFWAPLVVVWLAGGARVALAIAHHEAFSAEPTLAIAYLLALPFAGVRHWLKS